MKLARTALVLLVLSATVASAGEPRFEGAVFSNDRRGDTNMGSFSPDTRRIYLTVHVEDIPNDAKLKATWFVEKAAGFAPNSPIAASEVVMRPQMKTANYTIDKPGIGWPPGDYKVELAIDGKVQSTVRFKVAP
ncbi:MAG TPA: hypothetical protein VLT60_10470 [Usitatibacter sp.]|nr:hypothetical protein [Usitatibacter sp.]